MSRRVFKQHRITYFVLYCILSSYFVSILIPSVSASSASSATMQKVSDVLDGNTYDVFVVDSTAYVACGWGGLKVFDITDPSNPVLIGELDGIGQIMDVIIMDNHAFLCAGSDGLKIVDISNIEDMRVVSEVDEPIYFEFAFEVASTENYVIYGDGDRGLRFVDVSNPTSPIVLNDYNRVDFSAYDIFINDTYVYVANLRESRLEVLNISNIHNPIFEGSYKDGYGTPQDIWVEGELVYLADFEDGLEILNASNPSNLVEIGNYTIPNVQCVAVNGSYAYLMSENGFEVVDISDPANPVPVSMIDADAGELFLMDPYLYLSDPWHDGVSIVDISDPNSLNVLGVIDTEMYVETISVSDYILYCAGSDGISAVEVIDPANPVAFANFSDTGWTSALDSTTSYIFTSNATHFLVLDSDTMVVAGDYNHSSLIDAIEVEGDIAFIGCYNGTHSSFAILDISDPENPTLLSNYIYSNTNLQIIDGTVRDDLLFLLIDNQATGNSLLVPIDVTVPTHPIEITQYGFGYSGYSLCVDGDYAYITSNY